MRKIFLVLFLSCTIFLNNFSYAEFPRYVLITILHTNDIHGRITSSDNQENIGGLERISTLVKEIRNKQPNTLLLDAGDTIHGTPMMYLFKGEPIIKVMNLINYDIATIGNHEFNYGKEVLEQRIKESKFPFVSANLLNSENQVWNILKPYIIKEISGVKIAILGLITKETEDIEWEKTYEGLKFADPVEIAKEYLPVLKENADVVIVLGHLGIEEKIRLAKEVPEIDIIIGGHSHTLVDPLIFEGKTVIAQAGSHAKYLGRIDIILKEKGNNKFEINSVNGKNGIYWKNFSTDPFYSQFPDKALIKIDESIAPDNTISEEINYFKENLEKYLNRTIAETKVPLEGKLSRKKETILGNLICDIIREKTKTDISIFDTTIIDNNILEGEVKISDIFKILPAYTAQYIVVLEIKGSELKEVLEYSVSGEFKKIPLLLQVSGLSFTYDLTKKVGERIIEIKINGNPLEENKIYTLSTTAHLFQGKSGLTMLKNCKLVNILDLDKTVRDLIIEEIEKIKIIELKLQNRIKKLNEKNK